jgi:deoxyribodipyrimidine photolyase-related protein
MRNLVLILGDQLDRESSAFDGFDVAQDIVWMSETPEETKHVWCHKLRIAFFLAAMRHFRDELSRRDWNVTYNRLSEDCTEDRGHSFGDILKSDVNALQPQKLIVVEPGDHRVLGELRRAAAELSIELEIREDRSFFCAREEFVRYAASHKNLHMENFYRHMRLRHHVLIDDAHGPIGAKWNFDRDNRRSFGRLGPPEIKLSPQFPPDEITRQVIALVSKRFAGHPGNLECFDFPVDRNQALSAMNSFIEDRLAPFGPYQDAMWTNQPFLYHSRLSAALNVKLIGANELIQAAMTAYKNEEAPLNSVEGFVRQVIGWREFMRGVYWAHMPAYANRNELGAANALPSFYWTAKTDMNCLRNCLAQVLDHAYAHHIQRLMVLGNFALLYGTNPLHFHEWHMAMYADAVDWVSLPNTLGMSQYGDGGLIATKPYCAGGNYINRMSNYCRGCRYSPTKAVGDDACPFTTLYWSFLNRHRDRLASNPRMRYPLQNLKRKTAAELRLIHKRAEQLQTNLTG